MNRKLTQAILGLVLVSLSGASIAGGPWLGLEGDASVGVAAVHDTFDRAWTQGRDGLAQDLGIRQSNLWFWGQYSYSDRLTFTGQIGYTESSWRNSDFEYDGLADSKFGLQYQMLNEWEGAPITANVTSALIVRGTYERAAGGRPHAPGDKGNGVELGAQVGKFVASNLALWSDFGYRVMGNDVPDEGFFGVGASMFSGPFYFDAAWKMKSSTEGLDIMGAGFSGALFYQVREQREWSEWTAGWSATDQVSLSLTYANVNVGKNTGDSEVYSLGFGYSF